MIKMIFDTLHGQLKRKQWTANRADPTVVTMYEFRRGRRFSLTMLESWGVDTTVRIFGKAFRSYDAPFFVWLFSQLEAANDRRYDNVETYDRFYA